MRGGALEPPDTDDLVGDPSRAPGVPTDRFPAQRTALGAATVELPPRCRRGDAGCVPTLVGVRLVEHPPDPPPASTLSARQWGRVRGAVTGVVFVLLTAVGVHVGLRGPSVPAAVSPEEPTGAAAVVAAPRLAPPLARPPIAAHATAGHGRAPGHGPPTVPNGSSAPPAGWTR